MAGAEGFEPSTKVLDTHVLPLHHAPKHATQGLYKNRGLFVKVFLRGLSPNYESSFCIVQSIIRIEECRMYHYNNPWMNWFK